MAVPIYAAMVTLVALVAFFLLRASRDPYLDLHRVAVVGYGVFLALSANPEGYRLELVTVPTLAIALAFCSDGARRWWDAARASDGRSS